MRRIWPLVLLGAACSAPHAAHGPGGAMNPPPVDAGAPADGAGDAAGASTPGDPFAALTALPPTCSADGWCWRWPSPHGNDYVRVFSTAPDNVWLTARHGTIMQWDGHAWTFHHPPVLPGQETAQFPMSIGGSGPRNMWLIYGTTLQQWDGATWTIRDQRPLTGNPNFNNVWAAPGGDAFATVSDGTVRHFRPDGTSETLSVGASYFLGSIWGTAADDLYITTLPPGIVHYDGHGFTRTYNGPAIAGGYLGIKNDVWVSGGDGALLHWDGTAWTSFDTGVGNNTLLPVGRVAGNDLWWYSTKGLLHWNGSGLSTTLVDQSNLASINSAALIDGRWWLVGSEGTVYTRDPRGALASVIAPSPVRGMQSMWGAADDDMYFATGGALAHWNGAQLSWTGVQATLVSGLRHDGGDELFAVGTSRIDHTPDPPTFAVVAFHYDGKVWNRTQLEDNPLAAIRYPQGLYALGPDEGILVGTAGLAYHYVGGAWSPIATGTSVDFASVWGADPEHVYITGKAGTLLTWSRQTPAVAQPDATFPITARQLGPVRGAGGTVWVAQPETGSLWRNSGAGWAEKSAYTVGNEYGGLVALGADQVALSSSGNSLFARYDGTSWVRQDTNCGIATPLLFQPPGGMMWMGNTGALLQHR